MDQPYSMHGINETLCGSNIYILLWNEILWGIKVSQPHPICLFLLTVLQPPYGVCVCGHPLPTGLHGLEYWRNELLRVSWNETCVASWNWNF